LVGVWGAQAQNFLFWFVVVTSVVFVAPLALAPMSWARAFQWRLPDDPDLAFYFGRCLGALAISVEIVMWRGAHDHAVAPTAIAALGVFCAIMVVVHIDGAIRRIQPWTETAEIGFWAAAALGCVLFYPLA
jgi:hypothetical protein